MSHYKIEYVRGPLSRLRKSNRWGTQLEASEGPSVPGVIHRLGLAEAKWAMEMLKRQGATQIRMTLDED